MPATGQLVKVSVAVAIRVQQTPIVPVPTPRRTLVQPDRGRFAVLLRVSVRIEVEILCATPCRARHHLWHLAPLLPSRMPWCGS
mmetsp:Transcript_60509/g.112337  ORF Transcript_60509/g.112337 Transcript_60509/m.112337 type:complete len:84 (-) Transcript_60509:141-392(-)